MQQHSLLQTKLYIPPIRRELVSRPRLIERLNDGLYRKLTLISAPAGYGKTTLLSEWVTDTSRREPKVRIAWLSLDEGDNDPSRFLAYLVAALQTVEGDLGEGVSAALQSPGGINVEAVLTTLINEIANLSDDLVLVLDDYHVIESQPIDRALAFLLDHQPPQMHLFIASRTEPTLPLSRLRARGQLIELRVADLRFTTDEAAAFLHGIVRLRLSSEDVHTLEKRTEGWITGLQLAAVAMQGLEQRDHIAQFIHRVEIDVGVSLVSLECERCREQFPVPAVNSIVGIVKSRPVGNPGFIYCKLCATAHINGGSHGLLLSCDKEVRGCNRRVVVQIKGHGIHGFNAEVIGEVPLDDMLRRA